MIIMITMDDMDDMDDMEDMDDMDDMDDMKKVEKSQFQRDSAMAGWLTKFLPHHLTTPLCFYGFGLLPISVCLIQYQSIIPVLVQ